jgi:hypothetical protein
VQKNHVPVRLVDHLNSNDNGDWKKNAQSRLDECDIKLLATFAPSSQQDMQVQHSARFLVLMRILTDHTPGSAAAQKP